MTLLYDWISASAGMTEEKKLDSRFRGNDKRAIWIPAFAGMTDG